MSNKNYLSIYAKSFNWAGFFLPKKTYQKCSVLYDFCRTVDNIADDDGELDVKKKNLLVFKNDFINKDFNNTIINQSGYFSFLICEKNLVNFYKKNKWIKLDSKKIKVMGRLFSSNGMTFSKKYANKKKFCFDRINRFCSLL